jgi:SAM-dependent methyltransferase
MIYETLQRRLPKPLLRHILHFECAIEDAVAAFARRLPSGSHVLDAGAGEGQHRRYFGRHRYTGVDLAVGDLSWDYGAIDARADLNQLPFRSGTFAACVNVVTLEHVREPRCVIAELARTLAPGGRLLLIVPHEWEVHQEPHDYYRYTRHGIRYLLEQAGMTDIEINPVGGYFRLLSRRLLNGLQFFPGLLFPLAGLFLAPPALVAPLFDRLDRERKFTLGYICTARKPS